MYHYQEILIKNITLKKEKSITMKEFKLIKNIKFKKKSNFNFKRTLHQKRKACITM